MTDGRCGAQEIDDAVQVETSVTKSSNHHHHHKKHACNFLLRSYQNQAQQLNFWMPRTTCLFIPDGIDHHNTSTLDCI